MVDNWTTIWCAIIAYKALWGIFLFLALTNAPESMSQDPSNNFLPQTKLIDLGDVQAVALIRYGFTKLPVGTVI